MSTPSPATKAPPLVAVGASAGGPAALAVILKGLRSDFPGVLVIVQHVDDRFVGGLAEWLAEQSALPVHVAQEGEALGAGTVLLADGRGHLILRPDGRLGYASEPVDHPYRPSIDIFFESVSARSRGRVAGVLLTGMGSDGAKGLKALRATGGLTIAQDRATSAVYGMPKAAAAAAAACEILPLDRIAARLTRAFSMNAEGARP